MYKEIGIIFDILFYLKLKRFFENLGIFFENLEKLCPPKKYIFSGKMVLSLIQPLYGGVKQLVLRLPPIVGYQVTTHSWISGYHP